MAAPAGAQQPYSYPYAQPTYPQPTYPQQAYPPGYGYPQQGYAQPYGTNPVEQVINQLLGNSYNVNDRTAVSRCASAAIAQAQAQYGSRYGGYGAYGQQGYGQQGYGQYDQRYGYANNASSRMRVTAITNVERRRNSSLRVTGLISSSGHAQPYGNAYGYPGQRYDDPRYAQAGDLSFRCTVDYRGAVSGVRITRTSAAYRR